MNKFLVVRCSSLDGTDPIGELDSVISTRGLAWFGKYGQRVGGLPNLEGKTDSRWFVLLTSARPPVSKSYRLLGWSTTPPQTSEPYPAYYEAVKRRIGTWLKVEPLVESDQVDLASLVVKSSGTPIRTALRDSMRGHFWCIKRGIR